MAEEPVNVELKSAYYCDYLRQISAKIASPYSLQGRHHKNLNAFIQESLRSQTAGSRVLDAGCGLSVWLTPEYRQLYNITGVDVQPESIAACHSIYPGEDYRLGDLYALEFPDGMFDAVVMREVVEHFTQPERAINEVLRVLRPGGLFILTTPNYDSWLLHIIEHTYNRFFGGPCKPYLHDVHPSKFRYSTLRAMLSEHMMICRYGTVDLGISLCCVARKSL